MRALVILLLRSRCPPKPLSNLRKIGPTAPLSPIAGCDKIIARAKDTKVNIAIAYSNRGNDYQNKGDHDKAIAERRLRAWPCQSRLGARRAYAAKKDHARADSDARAVGASLRRLGFEVTEKHDLTLPELTKELKAFGDRTPDFDWALVYYAGHGIEVGGVNYLIPVDAELATSTHVDGEAMPLDRVLAKVEGAKKLRLVILDACRENPFAAKMASAGATRSIGHGLARVEPEAGVLVAYSAKDGQVAQDDDGPNSPFAESLLKHLDAPGVEINMLFRRVHDDVRREPPASRSPSPTASCRRRPSFSKQPGRSFGAQAAAWTEPPP